MDRGYNDKQTYLSSWSLVYTKPAGKDFMEISALPLTPKTSFVNKDAGWTQCLSGLVTEIMCGHCLGHGKQEKRAFRGSGWEEGWMQMSTYKKDGTKKVPITCLQRSVVMSSWRVTTLGRGLIGTRSTPGRKEGRGFQKAASSREEGNAEP